MIPPTNVEPETEPAPTRDPATPPREPLFQPVVDFPRPLRPRRLIPAAVAAVLAVSLIPHADVVWKVVYGTLHEAPGSGFFSATEEMVSFTFLVTIFATIALFDRRRFSCVLIFVMTYLMSAALNESCKHFFGRARPTFGVHLDDDAQEWIEEYLEEHPDAPVRADGKDMWLLFKPGRPVDSNYGSFPSGHANAAFVLAAFMIALYPKGKILWLILACGCALARVRFRRHYFEDVLMGSAMGWTVANLAFAWPLPAKLANAIVKRLGGGESGGGAPGA